MVMGRNRKLKEDKELPRGLTKTVGKELIVLNHFLPSPTPTMVLNHVVSHAVFLRAPNRLSDHTAHV